MSDSNTPVTTTPNTTATSGCNQKCAAPAPTPAAAAPTTTPANPKPSRRNVRKQH